ncbi:cytochrome P450 [Phyllosticta capitalensis]
MAIYEFLFPSLAYGTALILLWVTGVAVYRITLHPIASIPGPKLAAITGLYEAWYNCVRRGRYYLKYEEMHDIYGKRPVVRIRPNEVHIRDPNYFDVLFSHNSKINKDPFMYKLSFSDSPAAFGTMEANHHRLRRNAMNKFFSSKALDRYEPHVHATFEKLIERLSVARKTGEVVRMTSALKAFAMDIISHFALGQSRNYLSEPDMGHRFQISLLSATSLMHWTRQSGLLVALFKRLPMWMTPILTEAPDDVFNDTHLILDPRKLTDAEREAAFGRKSGKDESVEGEKGEFSAPSQHDSLMSFLKDSPQLPPEERTPARISNEAHAMLAAGVDSMSNIFIVFVFEILREPPSRFLEPLLTELREAEAELPHPAALIPYRNAEKLPYLNACVREAMRLIPGVLGRLPRVNPHEAMMYPTTTADEKGEKQQQQYQRTFCFPPGTVMSMSLKDMLWDAEAFGPDPRAFRPERWLPEAGGAAAGSPQRARMERCFVPFSKGARSCIGLELAKRELFVLCANLFRRLPGLELFDTTADDIDPAFELFGPVPWEGSRGLRCKIRDV